MKYETGGAFRQALETRLRKQSLQANLPLTRLRKMVAFDRFLARLVKQGPTVWIVKGGLAIQLRIGNRARTTKDIDATVRGTLEKAKTLLPRAASLDLGDWFAFEVGTPSVVATGARLGGLRFPVHCLLDGRAFERFHVDIGAGDPLLEKPEEVAGPPLLDFAGIAPSKVPCYPLNAQIAEKVHAYTRPYSRRESSRVKDLVDILLIASLGTLGGSALIRAIRATFKTRATHPLPNTLPKPPRRWSRPYKKMARELDFGWKTIDAAAEAAARFVNPILQGTTVGRWDPGNWAWK